MRYTSKIDYFFLTGIGFLILFSTVVLRVTASSLFPLYFFFIFIALVAFSLFSILGFEIISLFSRFFYVGSIVFLILPILIGQITRGTVRWITLGALSIQPAEIIRPFLLVYFANYLTEKELTFKRLIKSCLLFILPVVLILIQPSLGVAFLTAIGFLGLLFSVKLEKKYFLFLILGIFLVIPVGWKVIAPYQSQRILAFLNLSSDPLGSGYNSMQSKISVGSGKLFGRGLGKGVQTQLSFLPERQTDFIFAAISEELGFIGSLLILVGEFFIFYKLSLFIDNSVNYASRTYITSFLLVLFSQTIVHIGMNLGLLPITGVPLPLVSAGGSSLLGTMIGLSLCLGARKK